MNLKIRNRKPYNQRFESKSSNILTQKRGQVVLLSLMLSITIIVLALALAPVIKESATIARNTTNMDCTNTSISNFNKATCIVTDMNTFYVLGIFLGIAAAIVGARILISP